MPSAWEESVWQAWERQGHKCARCGKLLVWDNRGKDGRRGAWEPHHRKPVSHGGTDYLRNCVILCINVTECHLRIGHNGSFTNRVVLNDYELDHLYDGDNDRWLWG